jgi:hypothetical protein
LAARKVLDFGNLNFFQRAESISDAAAAARENVVKTDTLFFYFYLVELAGLIARVATLTFKTQDHRACVEHHSRPPILAANYATGSRNHDSESYRQDAFSMIPLRFYQF